MSPFSQHIVRDTQRRQQLCEYRMISWKPSTVENVSFSYSLICQRSSTLFRMIFSWTDSQQTLASLALLCHGYPHISQIERSQCLCLESTPIRPTSAMVFRKVLYLALLCSRIIVPQLHHWFVHSISLPIVMRMTLSCMCRSSGVSSSTHTTQCVHIEILINHLWTFTPRHTA